MTLRYEDMNKNERFAATMGNLLRMTLGVAKDRIVKVDKLIGNCVYFKEGLGLKKWMNITPFSTSSIVRCSTRSFGRRLNFAIAQTQTLRSNASLPTLESIAPW